MVRHFSLFRYLSAVYELVYTIDELSLILTLLTNVTPQNLGQIEEASNHLAVALEHLQSTIQYLEIEMVRTSDLDEILSL